MSIAEVIQVDDVAARIIQVDAVAVRAAGIARNGVVARRLQVDAVRAAGIARDGVAARRNQEDADGVFVGSIPAAAVVLDGAASAPDKIYPCFLVVGRPIDGEALVCDANGYIIGLHIKHMVACYASVNLGGGIAVLRFDGEFLVHIHILGVSAIVDDNRVAGIGGGHSGSDGGIGLP